MDTQALFYFSRAVLLLRPVATSWQAPGPYACGCWYMLWVPRASRAVRLLMGGAAWLLGALDGELACGFACSCDTQ